MFRVTIQFEHTTVYTRVIIIYDLRTFSIVKTIILDKFRLDVENI